MRSSTSNSDPLPVRRPPLFRYAIVTVVVLVSAVAAVWHLTPFDKYEVLAATAPRPGGSEYYLASNAHEILFHGMGGRDRQSREADMLLFGSSRVLVAFTQPMIQDFFEKQGLSYYNLSFSGGTDVFARALVEKFDLRPRFAIVDANEFFTGENTPMAQRAMDGSYFDALKRVSERRAGYAVRHSLHKVVPHLSGRDLPWIASWMIFRSDSDGTWDFAAYKKMVPAPVRSPPRYPREIPEAHFRAAEEFKELLEGRGTRVVLTYVPSARNDRWRAVEMSERLGLPLISPELPDLMTYDGSHLDKTSVARFTGAMLQEFSRFDSLAVE